MSRNRNRSRWHFRLKKVFFVVLAILGSSPLVWCQTDELGTGNESSTGSGLQYTMHLASESGVSTLVPEKWGTLQFSMLNSRSEAQNLLCSTYFGQNSRLQYGRQFWIPAQSVLRIEQPILIPTHDPSHGQNLELHSLVFDISSKEALVRSEGGGLRHDAALIVTHESRNTAIVGRRSLIPDEVGNLVAACRVALGLSNSVSWLGNEFLPPDDTSLDALDHIVIADDRIVNDFAATEALRQWLNAGGHVWVMLDRVNPAVLQMLLGDDFKGHIIDRVGLTSVRVDEIPVLSGLEAISGETVEYEDPVDLVRMDVLDMKITHMVNGWPAAISVTCGDGTLLITTLGARGWMKRLPEGLERPTNPRMLSDYKPIAPMVNVSDSFFRLRPPELLKSSTMEPQVNEYIGYSIPSWGLIVGTLLGFSVCIIAIGLWLLRRGRLEQICWVGSVPALAVSLLLIQAGRINRQGIPATMASVQLVQTIRGTDDLRCTGTVATYQPDGSEFPIESTRGGLMVPDMTGLEQSSRRMVTTDLGVCHWENLRQTAGTRATSFRQSETVTDRLQAHVTFDAHGLSGQYSGKLPTGTDAIVATRNGRMGAILEKDGVFHVSSDDVFENGQYLRAALLNDEQDRRRRTFKQLLDNPERPDYPGRPQLMFWSEPLDNGFRFGEGMKNLGASLVAVPLIIDRPANGTEILIPSPFLNYINRTAPDGTQSAAIWNSEKKQWQERSTPSLAWLSFQIPRELLPIAASQARMDLKVSGPIGRVDFMGVKNGEVINLESIVNPVGSVSIDITDSDALAIDNEGRLSLGLSAGNQDSFKDTSDGAASNAPDAAKLSQVQQGKVNYWRIESLALQLSARTTEPAAKD